MSTTEPDTTTDSSTDSDDAWNAIIGAGVLDSHFEAAGAVVELDEIVVEVTDSGIRTAAVGPDAASMVDASLSVNEFDAFDVDGTERFGVNIEDFRWVLGLAEGNGHVELSLDGTTRKLHVSGDDFSYTYAPVDPEAIRSVPDFDTIGPDHEPSGFMIEASDLVRAINGCDHVDDSIELLTTDDGVELSSDGDLDDLTFDFGVNTLLDMDFDSGTESLYGTEYLKGYAKALDGEVRVDFWGEAPIRFRFSKHASSVDYYLAPRIPDGGR
jgi:hypothetical protein